MCCLKYDPEPLYLPPRPAPTCTRYCVTMPAPKPANTPPKPKSWLNAMPIILGSTLARPIKKPLMQSKIIARRCNRWTTNATI